MTRNIIFGMRGLSHPVLENQFFPDDLPADWKLDYYSNEFRAILVSPDELALQSKPSDFHDLLNLVADCSQELLSDEFSLMVDVSAQFTSIPPMKQPANEFGEKSINFILSLQPGNEKYGLYHARVLFAPEKYHVLIYQKKNKLEPMDLKQLVIYCRDYPAEKLYVFFAATTHALENCRNAIIMDYLL